MERFDGLYTGTVSFEPVDPPTAECPMGIRTISDMAGVSNLLGAVTMHAEHCPTPGMPTIPHGQFTITTEEGDTVTGVYFDDCHPVAPTQPDGELIECAGRFQVTGGTGQYAGSSGGGRETITVWFPGSFETQGWPIVYRSEGFIGSTVGE